MSAEDLRRLAAERRVIANARRGQIAELLTRNPAMPVTVIADLTGVSWGRIYKDIQILGLPHKTLSQARQEEIQKMLSTSNLSTAGLADRYGLALKTIRRDVNKIREVVPIAYDPTDMILRRAKGEAVYRTEISTDSLPGHHHRMANCQAMHRWVMSGFPDVCDGQEAPRAVLGIQYHVGDDRIFIQSRVAPDLVKMGVRRSRSYEQPEIIAGNGYAFVLRANPTRRIATSGKRMEIFDDADLRQWIVRKLSRIGASASAISITQESRLRGSRNGKSLIFGSVMFAGALTVTEPEMFRRGVLDGIGAGKAYGFGLLLLSSLSK